MKQIYFIPILALSILFSGCSDSTGNSADDNGVTAKNELENTNAKKESTSSSDQQRIDFQDLNGKFYFNGITLGMTKEEVLKNIGTTTNDDGYDESGQSDEIHTYESLGLTIGYWSNHVNYVSLTINPSNFTTIIEPNIAAQGHSSKFWNDNGDDSLLYFHSSPKQLLKVHRDMEEPLIINILAPDGNFDMEDWLPFRN